VNKQTMNEYTTPDTIVRREQARGARYGSITWYRYITTASNSGCHTAVHILDIALAYTLGFLHAKHVGKGNVQGTSCKLQIRSIYYPSTKILRSQIKLISRETCRRDNVLHTSVLSAIDILVKSNIQETSWKLVGFSS
jgi:hypothetical protein